MADKDTDNERVEYSISNEQVKGFCANFWIQLYGLFAKRFHQTKRSLGVLFIEIFVPIFLVASGFGFTKVKFEFNSEPRHFEVTDFNGLQRVFYNLDGTDPASNIAPLTVVNNLSNLTTDWSPSPVSIGSSYDEADAAMEIDTALFSGTTSKPLKPYRYGSYYF